MERNEAIEILKGFLENPLFSELHKQALEMAMYSLEADEAYQHKYEKMTGKEETEAHDINVETISDMTPKEALKYIWDFISTTNFKADDTTLFNLGRAIGTLDVAIYNKEKENEANNNN